MRYGLQVRACGLAALGVFGGSFAALPLACSGKNQIVYLDAGDAGDAGTDAEADAAHDAPADAGDSGAEPARASKLDLLFVVDNSIGMNNKQGLLKQAIPGLLGRLLNPDCVNDATGESTPGPSSGAACDAGWSREFAPLADIHLGIVTSSLGSHGGNAFCTENLWGAWNETQDDHGRLLGSVRPSLASYDGLGFLAWDPRAQKTPPGETSGVALISGFQDMLAAVGEVGCGFEAPLEAWYRFLIDPEPPAEITLEDSTATPVGIDETVLAQRAAFLRPDSLVAIVMLTDENDCSIIDSGVGWLVTSTRIGTEPINMPAGTKTCETDPNSECCRPCGLLNAGTPEGCVPVQEDEACIEREFLSGTDDTAQLRCFDQKRRFGYDFLYPIERYVSALRSPTLENRAGDTVRNPLFSGPAPRDPSLVLLGGIVGVPWQDVADSASLPAGARLRFLSASELVAQDRWSLMLGNGTTKPRDPLMIESSAPRTGTHPLTGDALAPPTSTNPGENPINGHEYRDVHPTEPYWGKDDLQYACIFPLPAPIDCSTELLNPVPCSCSESDLWRNRPICNPPAGGPAVAVQYFDKAYPGPRLLEVLKGVGDNAIVTSACPKQVVGTYGDPGYGYNPAATAIVDAMARRLAR